MALKQCTFLWRDIMTDTHKINIDTTALTYGMVQVFDERKLPKEAANEIIDYIVNQDGTLSKRQGREKANTTILGGIPHSLGYFREEK